MVEADVNASDDSLCDRYLSQVATMFTSGCAKGMFYSIVDSCSIAICILSIITSILMSSSLNKNSILTGLIMDYLVQEMKLASSNHILLTC